MVMLMAAPYRKSVILLFVLASLGAAEQHARNVILFLGDAAGVATISAASIHGYNAPQKLYIQHMPHIGLMDTSAANAWVTDSAAGMTAIVTGRKTDNGVLSQAPGPERGKPGEPLKTILEYAEEHGLSTGVVSTVSMADATPAACYSHVDSRDKFGEIFAQILTPRFGDGVDVVIGPGRKQIFAATAKLGIDLEPALKKKGYGVYDSVEAVPPDARRVIALFDTGKFDFALVVRRAIEILSRNKKGYFLMVEPDMHTDNIKAGLDRAVMGDKIIRETAGRVGSDTLIVFAADHSFDIRVRGGRPGEPLLPPAGATPAKQPSVRMDDSHTGEEVMVAAQGPGSQRVQGYFANTDLFHIMMAAYGWEKPAAR
jgi:alkaline phosphatase